jgi:hypothetical protein
LLEGKVVDLRIGDRNDVNLLAEWFNHIDFCAQKSFSLSSSIYRLEDESQVEVQESLAVLA